MRTVYLVSISPALIAPTAKMQTLFGTAADERAIQNNRDAHDAAWNKHDAKALAALFAPDADRATVNGWFSGRAEIEKGYVTTFGGAFKNATLTNESPKLKFLTADVAMLDVDNIVTGRADGMRVKNHSTSSYD